MQGALVSLLSKGVGEGGYSELPMYVLGGYLFRWVCVCQGLVALMCVLF